MGLQFLFPEKRCKSLPALSWITCLERGLPLRLHKLLHVSVAVSPALCSHLRVQPTSRTHSPVLHHRVPATGEPTSLSWSQRVVGDKVMFLRSYFVEESKGSFPLLIHSGSFLMGLRGFSVVMNGREGGLHCAVSQAPKCGLPLNS